MIAYIGNYEFGTLIRELGRRDEDPAIDRARRHLERERSIAFILEVLDGLRKDGKEEAA